MKNKTKDSTQAITVSPPKEQTVVFTIRGDSPYVQNKFSEKAKTQMRQKQEEGSTAKKGKIREAKNFKEIYKGAMHVADSGWCGIPCSGLRQALIDSCRMVGFAMTRAKLSLFVEADGFDKDDQTALFKITKGKPEYLESTVRLSTGVCDICPRPVWKAGWEAVVRIRFDCDQFTVSDVTNLLVRVGRQVGLGAGRHNSKTSAGCGWGTFTVVNK